MVGQSRHGHVRKNKIPYLGKISTRWCPSCDVPIIKGDTCPRCLTTLVIPEISPPGDSRPAFEYDVELLRKTCDEMFVPGTGEYLFPPNQFILFNKPDNLLQRR